MIFRPEQSHEVEAIHAVERAAFGREAEADLVDQIRASGGITLSLVAVDDDEIVGHVLFSPVTIRSERGVGDRAWQPISKSKPESRMWSDSHAASRHSAMRPV
jgi:predicted N-acetyltransferase YhbS